MEKNTNHTAPLKNNKVFSDFKSQIQPIQSIFCLTIYDLRKQQLFCHSDKVIFPKVP